MDSAGGNLKAAGADYDAVSGEGRKRQQNGEQVDFRERGPPCITMLVTPIKHSIEETKPQAVHTDAKTYSPPET